MSDFLRYMRLVDEVRILMPHRVLVVEDEPLVRMLAVDVVEEAGFEAVEASNADEALDLLDKMPDIRLLFTHARLDGRPTPRCGRARSLASG